MAPFRWIARLIAGLWAFSRRSWIDVGLGLRPRSGASALVLFLFLLFFLVGLVLVLLGINLGSVDRWIDAHAGALDRIASLLFRAVCGLVILLCLLPFYGFLFDRDNPYRPGLGCLILAPVVAYFAWFGLTGE